MTTLIRKLLIASLILLTGSAASADTALAPLERGRELTQLFLDGDLAPVHDAFSVEMIEMIGDVAELVSFREQVLTQLGEETIVLDESVVEDPSAHLYVRTARFSLFQGPVIIQWALNDAGTVIGFYVAPGEPTEAAPPEYLDYVTQASLRLPFKSEWTVGWGGRSVEDNYHAAYVDQRFAYDFVIVRNGSSHEGSGSANEDYYCFGHGAGEYSFLAHLREGSVTVAPGQHVAAGEQVGACGNSEPVRGQRISETAGF